MKEWTILWSLYQLISTDLAEIATYIEVRTDFAVYLHEADKIIVSTPICHEGVSYSLARNCPSVFYLLFSVITRFLDLLLKKDYLCQLS